MNPQQSMTNLIKLNPEASDAEIVAMYEAASYQPLSPPTIAAWLAAGARLLSLRTFAAEHDAQDTPQLTGLRSAVDTLLLSLSVPGVSLDLSPGSDQRQLVEAVSTLGLPGVGAEDVGQLIARARTREPITEQDVADARAKLARREEVNARRAALQAWLDQQMATLDAAVDDASIELPEVPA